MNIRLYVYAGFFCGLYKRLLLILIPGRLIGMSRLQGAGWVEMVDDLRFLAARNARWHFIAPWGTCGKHFISIHIHIHIDMCIYIYV